ncbi:Rho GTPase-activating protein REN1 [Hirschfeldia incana]|nr:Rho GTPase-activating protein REN1 [Hirschfeldia incana]
MAPTKTAESSSSSSSSQPQPPLEQQQNHQDQQQNSNPHEQDLETHGDTCSIPQSGNSDSRSRGGNTVFKSGPLSISSKGLGWTSWKKRWFILTRTSLVFFRSDPSAVQQRGSEVNLTLGGIDLNNSGSVVVKADKKLLTVLFPDGRDGRAFTLKADTMEDLNEWKAALENALTQAPNASHVMGQNGIFTNDHADAPVSVEEQMMQFSHIFTEDETPTKSTVIGRPVLLALEDVDGSPSFLEKALRFVEDHGINVEGILRQAADVDDVEHRIREYEQGKNEFAPTEDAHVIADCLKYVLRELPSSPVPASCCNALLEACRTDRGNRVSAMREAICESFPEPNRRLLQRILTMMQVVASNKNVNRMNTNAVAACMAPLLLRPLLAGDCEIENDFDVGGDGSMQLLQAAAAANHAQAIVITLLEEYASIFGEGTLSPGLYSDSEESGSGTEEGTDDEEYDDDDDEYDGTQGSEDYTDEEEDLENESNGSYSESVASDHNHAIDIDRDDHKPRSYTKINANLSSESKTPKGTTEPQVTKKLLSNSKRSSLPRHDDAKKDENILVKGGDSTQIKAVVEDSETEDKSSSTSDVASDIKKPSTLSSPPGGSNNRRWGRTPGKKNLPMEPIDFAAEVEVDEDDADIERLESTKSELQNSISEEVKNNAVLQASLERRKKALYVRRDALEKDVERLQDQLQQERDKKSALESGLKMSKGNQPIPEIRDEKLKKDLEDVAQAETDIANLEHKVDDLENRLSQQDVKASGSTLGASKESWKTPEHNAKMKEKQKDTEADSTHVSERSLLKDEQGSARETEVEKQQDSRSKSSQQETSRGSSKSAGMSKRSGSKGEGNTTTSALSKLTMRLNFLKERRSQIASELSNMDKGKSTGQPSPSSVQNQSLQETGSNQNQESHSSKLHSQHVLDRGRSENGGERGRGGSGRNQPSTTPRTFSR